MKANERFSYTFASGNSYGDIFLWSLGFNNIILQLNSNDEPIQSLNFSSSGDILLSSTRIGALDIWNLHTGQNIRRFTSFDGTTEAIFHPYSFLVSTIHQNTISLWDPRSKNLINSLVNDDSYLTNLKFSPDGLWLCSGDQSGKTHIWDLRTAKYHHKLDVKENDHSPIINLCFHPMDTFLAIASSQYIYYWDISNMNCTNIVSLNDINLDDVQLAFNRDKLISFKYNGFNIYNIDEMDNYSCIKLPNVESSNNNAISITVDSSGNTVGYISKGSKIQVWFLNNIDQVSNTEDDIEIENQNLINEMLTTSKEFANHMTQRLNSLKDILSKGENPLQTILKLKPETRSKLLIELIVLKILDPSTFRVVESKLVLTTLQNHICNISEEQAIECIFFLKSMLKNFGQQFKESFISISNQLKSIADEKSLKFNEELNDFIEKINTY